MTADDRFTRLDELVEAYNDVLDRIYEVRTTYGGTRPELETKSSELTQAREEEIQNLLRAGVAPEEIEAHLEATDHYRHGR